MNDLLWKKCSSRTHTTGVPQPSGFPRISTTSPVARNECQHTINHYMSERTLWNDVFSILLENARAPTTPGLKNKWRCQVLFCLRIYHSRRMLPARPNYMVPHNRISLINHEPGFLRRHVCKSEKYESCRWDPQTCRRIDFRGRVTPLTHISPEILHIFSVFNILFMS